MVSSARGQFSAWPAEGAWAVQQPGGPRSAGDGGGNGGSKPDGGGAQVRAAERQFFIDNLLVRIHFIIVMIRWTGLAPWGFEFPFPGTARVDSWKGLLVLCRLGVFSAWLKNCEGLFNKKMFGLFNCRDSSCLGPEP